MRRNTHEIEPLRLCAAADAAILAVTEAQETGAPTLYPPDLMGTPEEPACLEDFTRTEVEAGCLFLIRLGLLRLREAGAPADEGGAID